MNKLLVSDIIKLDNGSYILNSKTKKLDIEINGEVKVYLLDEELSNLNIILKDNSYLDIYIFNNDIKNELEVNIKQNNKTKINYNESLINREDNKLTINNDILGNDNESHINIRNISNKGDSSIIVNVFVDKKTINNVALEDIKGINNGGYVHVEPNIVCLSNEVSANHLTTIGSLDEDSVNYLISKGINEINAKELLLKGFIYSPMDDYIKKNNGGD